MTPQEQQAITDKAAARAAVLAKFPDPAAVVTDEDCRLLNASEIKALINANRLQGIGADKRIRGRA
jgi:hypothetical protein